MKKSIISILTIILCLFICSCNTNEDKYYFVNIPFATYFDTTGYIVCEYNKKNQDPYDIKEDINNDLIPLLDELEQTFAGNASKISYSLTKEVNSKAGKEIVEVNEYFMEVFLMAKGITSNYNKFDITCGALTSLWDISNKAKLQYDSDSNINMNNNFTIPSQDKIDAAIDTIQSIIEYDDSNIYIHNPNTELDFGAIAKGYAVDKIKELIINKGFDFFVINFGGNVYIHGLSKQDQYKTIPVSIQVSSNGTSNLIKLYETNTAIVTSGINNRYITINNVKYPHIIDLTTGYPINNNIESVTIIYEDSALSDAFATLVLVSGVDDGIQIIKENNLKGLIVTKEKKIYMVGSLSYQLLDSSYEIIKK